MVKVKTGFQQLGRVTVLVVGILLLVGEVAGQTNGDYRTRNTGNWNSSNTWQVYNGGWNNCAAGDYPGVTTGAGTVTILTNHNVTLTNSPLFEIGELIIQTGNNATTLTYSSNWVLSVIGDVNVSSTTNNQAKSIVLNTGTLNCNNLTLTSTGGNDNRDAFVVLTSGTLNVSGNLTMNASGLRTYIRFNGGGSVYCGATITGGNLTSAANGSAAAPTSGTVYYDNTGNQNIGSYTYYNLTVSGGGTKQLTGNTTVSNNLTLNSGIIRLDNYNLTLSNNAATAVQGTPGAASYVETNGTGNLVRNIGATLPIAFPVGSGGYYSPMSVNYTGTGTVSVKTVPSVALGSKYVKKYWDVLSSAGVTVSQATFTYDPAEADVSPTNIWVKSSAGVWQAPTGTASFGTNSFTIAGTSDITNTVTSWTAGPLPGTFFSYQSGPWDQASTWTSDPGGSTHVNIGIPGDGDVVVILPNRIVNLTSDVTASGLEININSGGFLDMSTFSFTSGLAALKGEGTLQLASVNFPTATKNTFVNAGGGTTEYNNSTNFTLPIAQTIYNNLTINTSGVIATQLSNLTLNGNLLVKQGSFQINDNSATTKLNLLINGNVTVNTGAYITVGNGSTNSVTSPLGINGGTAPFLNYYEYFHRITIYGDFTNNGTVRFTNLNYPIYNAFPPLGSVATSGAASVYFMGASNNTLYCNGTTDFYNLILDKGTDQTYSLTVYSSEYDNFRLFGANTASATVSVANPDLKKALWIRTGTLALTGLVVIPSLTEGASAGSEYYIPSNGALVIDGSDVIVLATADDYREVDIAYGTTGTTGVNTTGAANQGLVVYGKLEMNDGYLSTRESAGLLYNEVNAGLIMIDGGVVDAKQFRSYTDNASGTAYRQTSGILILRGRFIRPVAYSSIGDLSSISGTLSARAVNGTSNTYATFNINDASNIFSMTGGTVRIYDACGAAGPQFAVDIISSSANSSVTGGTFEILPQTGTVLADPSRLLLWSQEAVYGNVTINRGAGCTTSVELRNRPLTILKNFTITSGEFISGGQDVTVGGNMTVATAGTYNSATNLKFNGSGHQVFTISGTINNGTVGLGNIIIDKSADTLKLAGTNTSLTVQGTFDITNGIFSDGGKTVYVAGNITNNGIHTGAGAIQLNGTNVQTIGGSGSGIFQNLELNNNNAASAPVSITANTIIRGALTFSRDKLLNIGTYNLKFDSTASVINGGTNRYIITSGNAGDGGITKTYSSIETFNFPLGISHYTPASIGILTAPTKYGSITVVPVNYEHPNVTTKGRSLTYFWRVKSSGFSLGTATFTHGYTYNIADVVTGTQITDGGYVAARYNASTFTWTNGTIDDIDETNHIIGEPGTGNFLQGVSFIDGDYTAGDDSPTNPFGTPTKYYSRQSGLWSDVNNWSLTSHIVNDPPATVPDIDDIVIIGGNDSIYLTTNNTVADAGVQNCASLMIEKGSALDVGYNPGCTFGMVQSHPNGNGNFRLTTSYVDGSTFVFPSGDFSDFNQNLGTTELYSTNSAAGTTYWLPNNILSYGNLIISPLGGSNIIFGNTNLTIYGNCITRGQNADSWFCPTWSGNYPGNIARVSKTITIKGNLDIQGGSFGWYGGGSGGAQNIVVHRDVIVALNSGIDVWSSNTSQSLSIGGSLINNTSGVAFSASSTCHCDFTNLPVTFFGDSSAYITNTSGSPITIFNGGLTVNKGSSQSTMLTCNIGGTLTTPNNNWFTLLNGTFKYTRVNPATNFTISGHAAFTIPGTAGLYIDYPNANNTDILISQTNTADGSDLYLNGKLTIISGNVYIGNGTSVRNNDIEYSGSGASEIDIRGGELRVNGQIRRSPSTSDGVLKYSQSGGTVTIFGFNANTTNAKFEVCNTGSVFNMSAGSITIQRGGGGTTYGDFYLRPASYSVTGGDIIFEHNISGTAQTYRLDATAPLYNMIITGRTAATPANAQVYLMVNPLVLNGSLTLTNQYSILNSNNIGVTIKGDLINNGTTASYVYGTNLTTFNGNIQQLRGTSATNFYNINISPVTSVTLNHTVTVNNNLAIGNGSLICRNNAVYVKNDLANNGTYTDTQYGIILNGTTSQQEVSGTGTFSRLELNNTYGAKITSDITLNRNLVLTNGIFDINSRLLTLGQNSIIDGTGLGINKMVTTNGVLSDNGISKVFGTGATTFTYPLGVYGKYTPAVLTITDNASTGTIRVLNVNNNHPAVIDPSNVLQYYWLVESSGITDLNGNFVMNYNESDVSGGPESNYIAARLIIPGTSWSKTSTVNGTANTITFTYTNTSNLSGEYTAGNDPAIPNNVPIFTSNQNGNWNDPTIWDQTGGDPYTLTGGPNGFIVNIDHTVSTDANYCEAYRSIINSRLHLLSPYYGHNFGYVSGSGTLYLESGLFPAGQFDDFLSCSNTSTIEYGGTGDYTIIADLYDRVSRLLFTGSGTRTLPNKDLTICRLLDINGPILNNTLYNRGLNIEGEIILTSGAFNSGTGSNATVSFTGSTIQSVANFNGTNAFNNLRINNSAGLNLNSAIVVNNNLILTSGLINTTSANSLTLNNSSVNCVIPAGGSTSSYVNGPLIKKLNQGDTYFQFPVGNATTIGNKMSLKATETGTLYWIAQYINPSTYKTVTGDLTAVNEDEYWNISTPSGGKAIVNIKWDAASDLTPLMTQNGVEDMRVAEYNGTNWAELSSIASGDDYNGSAETLTKISLAAGVSKNYTLACINQPKPRIRFAPTGPICGTSGIPINLSTAYTIYSAYSITYTIDGAAQTPYTPASFPAVLSTISSGGVYKLTGFTYHDQWGVLKTGVVDVSAVTGYSVPTTANAGADQSLCGNTSANLSANTPTTGTGLWEVLTLGAGGTVSTPTDPASAFSGTNGSAYDLRWTITNGTCTSSDIVRISFPLLPVQPTAFTSSATAVCQGQSGVAYAVANDPNASSYNWSYTVGSGATLNGSGNSITYDFATNATSGTVSVSTTNGCGTSSALTLGVTVNVRPTITLGTPSSVCVGSSPSTLTYSATLGSPNQYSINYDAAAEALGFADVANTVLPVSPINLVVPGTASAATYNATLSVRNSATLCTSPLYPITITINPLPVTGPMYRQPNN